MLTLSIKVWAERKLKVGKIREGWNCFWFPWFVQKPRTVLCQKRKETREGGRYVLSLKGEGYGIRCFNSAFLALARGVFWVIRNLVTYLKRKCNVVLLFTLVNVIWRRYEPTNALTIVFSLILSRCFRCT